MIGADSGFAEKPGGWRYGLPVLSYNNVNIPSNNPYHPEGYCTVATSFVFTDSTSSRSALSLALANVGLCGSLNVVPQTSYTANNDPFYKAWTQNGAIDAGVPFYVTNASGTLFHFPFLGYGCISGCNVPDYIEDRNGNKITITENGQTGIPLTVKDTTGRTLLSIPGFGNSGDTVTVSGDSAPYTLQWQTINTGFTVGTGPQLANPANCSATNQFLVGPARTVISSITLPNGKKYQFSYDATYGFLSKIVYPNGGYVSYTWGVNTQSDMVYWFDSFGYFPGCEVRYSPPAISHRYVSYDGVNIAQQQDFTYFANWSSSNSPTWTYKTTTVKTTDFLTLGNPSTFTVYTYSPATVPDPLNIESRTANQVPMESSIAYQDGAQVTKRTVIKTWGSGSISSQQTVLENGQTSQTNYFYGTLGVLTEKDEYDFGSGASGALLRKTVNNYQSFSTTPLGTNIYDRPCQTIVYDGSTPGAETDYFYDGGSAVCGAAGTPSVVGVTGLPTGTHDEINYAASSTAPRGNLTQKTQWLSTGGSPVTTYTYDSTGQVLTMKDPCGNATCADMTGTTHTTTYSYADSYTSGTPPGNTNAYLTKITRPATNGVNHISNFSYGYADGQLTVSKDENNQPTTYSYVDSLARLTSTVYPDSGQTTISYDDTAPTPSITQNTLITTSPSLTLSTKTVMDGLGHVIQTQLTTDPDGTDFTDTTYDGLGRVRTRLNPHRTGTSSTDGTTTYTYDSLGRTTQVLQPDNSPVNTSYTGNCTTVTDEAGKTRTSCSDGLGRLTKVFEAPTGPGALNYETDYQYDALDNLKQVDQKGNDSNSANWRTRLFQYDSLSRLTSASNPESGTTTYSYDNNGNLSSKVAPQPNQTGSLTVTTNYIYDVLNRLTQKSYVGISTPLVKYGYDGTVLTSCPNNAPPTLSDTYPIGRRTAMCDGSGATSWNHDQVGRSLTEQRKIVGSSAVTKGIGYLYNKDGSISQITYPSNRVVTYTYNGAGRAISAIDVPNSVNYVTAATYTPPGGLLTYKNGVTGSFAGISVNNGYNNRLQPTLISATTPTATFFSLGYGYGPANQNNGNPSTIVNNLIGASGRNQTFIYDALNRISTAQSQATSGTACWGQGFGYDAWGNLQSISQTKCSPAALSAAADNKNHMIGFNYDAAGNLTKEGSSTPVWNYSWDAENRLSSISGSASDTFTYDGDGERVKKSNGALFWRQHGGPFLTKTGLSGTIIVERIFFNGLHVAAAHPPSGPVNYLFQDHLGGEHIITDATGNVCQDVDSLPFGSEIFFNSGCLSSYRFAGLERDDENSANLDYAIGRYYDNRLGRFLSPDEPFMDQDTGDPQSWNLYTYVRNNPLSNTDPTGNACVNGKDDDRGGQTCAQVAAEDAEFQKQHRASATVSANDGTQEGRIFELSYAISDLTRFHSMLNLAANAAPAAFSGYGLARLTLAAPALTTLNIGPYALAPGTVFNAGKGLLQGEAVLGSHAADQAVERGVTASEIKEALTHVPKGQAEWGSVLRFRGVAAEVRVNKVTGTIVTVIRFSSPRAASIIP
jgi:RHS repeat-associated protein